MSRVLRLSLFGLLLIMSLPLLAQSDDLPDEIIADYERLHPEGIEYDAVRDRFLVGSLMQGSIFSIDDDGTVTPFIEDENFSATTGIHIDTTTDRLLVANSDSLAMALPFAEGIAGLGIYDLETGEALQYVDAGAVYDGRHFANDVTSDEAGNAYLTDSLSPVIYRITPEGTASVFLENEAFSSDGMGLNGIEYHPDGYLLVSMAGTRSLYKVPLDDPEAFTRVETDRAFSADGLVWHPDGYLVAVATIYEDDEDDTGIRKVLAVTGDDDWQTASVAQEADAYVELSPTTAAIRDGAVYVVHARFGEMFGGTVSEFPVLRVPLNLMDNDG